LKQHIGGQQFIINPESTLRVLHNDQVVENDTTLNQLWKWHDTRFYHEKAPKYLNQHNLTVIQIAVGDTVANDFKKNRRGSKRKTGKIISFKDNIDDNYTTCVVQWDDRKKSTSEISTKTLLDASTYNAHFDYYEVGKNDGIKWVASGLKRETRHFSLMIWEPELDLAKKQNNARKKASGCIYYTFKNMFPIS